MGLAVPSARGSLIWLGNLPLFPKIWRAVWLPYPSQDNPTQAIRSIRATLSTRPMHRPSVIANECVSGLWQHRLNCLAPIMHVQRSTYQIWSSFRQTTTGTRIQTSCLSPLHGAQGIAARSLNAADRDLICSQAIMDLTSMR